VTAWTAEDIRVASLLEAQLGPIRVIEVIEHKENRMTDTVAPDVEAEGWEPEDGAAFGGATYPEYPYSLADHVYTWSPKLPDGSMLVIRASTAEALAEAAEAVAPLAGRLRAAWQIAVGQPAAPQAVPPAMQSQPNYNPQMPPPNQPYPGQPAWQQGGAAPAAPQWGGGQQAQAPAKEAYPAPQGWYRLNVPYPGGKDQLHALAQSQGIPKGNPAKGGAYNFFGAPTKAWYCSPQAAPALAQFNPMPA
jgi:hypothetical protein